jgi:hypothetical protein
LGADLGREGARGAGAELGGDGGPGGGPVALDGAAQHQLLPRPPPHAAALLHRRNHHRTDALARSFGHREFRAWAWACDRGDDRGGRANRSLTRRRGEAVGGRRGRSASGRGRFPVPPMFFSAFFIFLWRGFWILDSRCYFWVRANLGRAGGAGPRRSHATLFTPVRGDC